MTTPFWSNDPTVLFKQENIMQLYPTQDMNYEAKLNAITRIVILISILGYLFTKNINIIIICILTLAILFSLYKFRKQKIFNSLKKETFTNNKNNKDFKVNNTASLKELLKEEFYPTNKKNPFGNVLLTDIMDKPDRNSAAPSFNPQVYNDINTAVKKQSQMLNPGIKNTNKQLYGDLKDNYDLDNSLMRFYSTANTRVTNDQGAFSQWLYGNMPSGKSSGPDGAYQRVKDNERYILI
jgi:hypothetical protein